MSSVLLEQLGRFHSDKGSRWKNNFSEITLWNLCGSEQIEAKEIAKSLGFLLLLQETYQVKCSCFCLQLVQTTCKVHFKCHMSSEMWDKPFFFSTAQSAKSLFFPASQICPNTLSYCNNCLEDTPILTWKKHMHDFLSFSPSFSLSNIISPIPQWKQKKFFLCTSPVVTCGWA